MSIYDEDKEKYVGGPDKEQLQESKEIDNAKELLAVFTETAPDDLVECQNVLSDSHNHALNLLIKKARTNFYAFTCLMAPTIIPEGFINGRHIERVCWEIQLLLEQIMLDKKEKLKLSYYEELSAHTKRTQLFLPPGGMKSLLCSRLAPAWAYGRWNHFRCISIGHGIEFAKDNFGRPLLALLKSEAYKAIFPELALKVGMQSADRFETEAGGTYMCAGVGANIAGRRAHLTICDDAMSEQTAISKTERNKINAWYIPGLRSRLAPRPAGGELLVMTRWHLEDLCGFMEATDRNSGRPWRILKLPALLDEEASEWLREPGDPDDYLVPGTSFWPELWPTERFEETRRTAKPSDWNALYMQNPIPEGGSIIREGDINIWTKDTPPKCSTVIVSLDTAFSEKERADYSAYTVWGVFNEPVKDAEGKVISNGTNNVILLDGEKGRWDFPTLCGICIDIAEKMKPDVFLIEKKGSGISLIQELRRLGLPIATSDPRKDKETRMHVASAYTEGGKVWFPDAPWADDIKSEIVTFPNAGNDDIADTFSQVMIYLRDRLRIAHPDSAYSAIGEYDDEEGYASYTHRRFNTFGEDAEAEEALGYSAIDGSSSGGDGDTSYDFTVSYWSAIMRE